MALLQSSEFRTDQFEGYYNALLDRPDDPAALKDDWVMSNLDIDAVRIAFESTQEFFQADAAIVQDSQSGVA